MIKSGEIKLENEVWAKLSELKGLPDVYNNGHSDLVKNQTDEEGPKVNVKGIFEKIKSKQGETNITVTEEQLEELKKAAENNPKFSN